MNAHENGQEKTVNDQNHLLKQMASLIITYTDKILKPQKNLEVLIKTV
jgi:hypothetical protein